MFPLLIAIAITGAEAPMLRVDLQNTYVIGDRIEIPVTAQGFEPSSFSWSVHPNPSPKALRIYETGDFADFVTGKPGKYTFVVSAAGANDGAKIFVTHTVKEIEVISATSSGMASVPNAAAVPIPNPKASSADVPAIAATPEKIIGDAAMRIPARAFKAGQPIAIELINAYAMRIDKGLVVDNKAMGEAYTYFAKSVDQATLNSWLPWFREMNNLLNTLSKDGVMQDASNWSAAFRNIAGELSRYGTQPK